MYIEVGEKDFTIKDKYEIISLILIKKEITKLLIL